MRALLAPIDAGALPNVEQFSFSLENKEIAVQLFNADTRGDAGCPGPKWVRTPGAFFLSRGAPDPNGEDAASLDQATQISSEGLTLRYYWCEGEAPHEALASLADSFAQRVNESPEDQGAIWRALPPPEPEKDPLGGLLTPATQTTGLGFQQLTLLLLLALTVLSLGIGVGLGPALPGPLPAAPTAKARARGPWIALAGGLAAALAVRLLMLRSVVLDADESWALPFSHSVFHQSHDPWVHPPLFHLLHQPYVHALDWTPELGHALLRAPTVAAGVLALALLGMAIVRRGGQPALLLCAVPVAFAPDFIRVSSLARPYGLASLLVLLVALGLWSCGEDEDESPMAARLRWSMILLAAGLTTWADLLAGAAAGTLVLARMLDAGLGRQLGARGVLAGGLALGLLLLNVVPLLPGVLGALEYQIDPETAQETLDALGLVPPGDVMPDADLTRRVPAFFVFGLDRYMLPFGALALLAVLSLAALGWRQPQQRISALLPLALLLGSLAIASTTVHLRARNLNFAPLLVAYFACLTLEGRRRPKS